jgi:hypothetical protein
MPRADLTIPQILAWADAHHGATGHWPTKSSGGIPGALGETWKIIDRCLRHGERGLPGGSSLSNLLAEHRGKRNIHRLPELTEDEILTWADEHHRCTGDWPTADSGTIDIFVTFTSVASPAFPEDQAMPNVIAYYRVSTRQQSQSGLGLEGQRAAVEAYARQAGAEIRANYIEVESGKRSDRPGLARALAHARRSRATLVVAKLDRLARNLEFLAKLMNSEVDFIA